MESIGMPYWVWVALGVFIACAAAAIGGLVLRRTAGTWDDRWDFVGTGAAVLGVIIGGMAALFLAIGLFPYKPDYWPMYRVEGTVTSVSNVLTEDGGDLSRVPVLTLDTFDQPITVEDPRAVTLEGKHVALRCDRQWVQQGMDRYSCAIQSIG
ncbi:hypothetical protein [Corynebacterium sp.]|uniref:hypothetical protein n=1 Tax=Corynebacterium sp. TaxID=1720 RepID=UPI002F3FBA22